VVRILVIDDNQEIAEIIGEMLGDDYLADYVTSGDEGLRALGRKKYGLILLDIKMPGKSGYEVLKILKESDKYKQIPVIIISQDATGIEPTLSFGADDFINKPFDKNEIIARVQAVLRRRQFPHGATSEPKPPQASAFRSHPVNRAKVYIDNDRHEVFIKGVKVKLSPMEYRLLALFLGNRGLVLSRGKIIEHLQVANVTDRTIDCHVNHLRNKLGPCRQLLQTVRSFGYRFSE
jgi:DNA-binding response OmpR family regulator